ncbi:peptidase A24A prepilin type IV [Ammonifex degensii KC4]|uniref:Peptidase A24A prepilin type IV n=1 Tax=Ammonifex degensii (strain DSM 10501 / KC4) TaxID=429009 RepID=C9RCF7_AMMDK|nr:prepilin peptidase [Ammonifex degensii]ACX51934.1 peptidase A24A prepilin type IV [Ammonifex degensii KC4]
MLVFAVASVFLLWASVVDLKRREIPDGAVLGVLLCALARLLACPGGWAPGLAGGLSVACLYLFLRWASGGGVGGGDVKLGAAAGLLLGWPASLLMVGVASATGLLHCLASRQRGVPLAPHIFLGCLAACLLDLSESLWVF